MQINVVQESETLVPIYYFDRVGHVVQFWEWVTPEEAERIWFKEKLVVRYGKEWGTSPSKDRISYE